MNTEVQQGAPSPNDVADCVPVTRMNPVLWASAVVVGLMARMALIFIWHTYRNDPAAYQPQWFGAETGSIARSIAQGHRFSSPFGGETGPTAWIGPIYPYLCAAVFKAFGIFGERSAQVILSINSLVSALTCIPVYILGRRVFSRSVGLIACWAWAVMPFFMRWPTTWVWDMAFTALLVVCLLLQAVRLSESASSKQWALMGALIGVGLLLNPALLTVAGVAVLWAIWQNRDDIGLAMRRCAVCLFIALVAISPWLIRNRVAFGQFVFLRSNFGFEFHLGNYHLSNGMGWSGRHPVINANELNRYRQMGELAYVQYHGQEAWKFVREYPAEFASLTAHRFLWFWDGEYINYSGHEPWKTWMFWPLSLFGAIGALAAIRDRMRGSLLLTAAALAYGLPYYITYPQHRYRHPVEPLLLLLVAYVVVELWRRTVKACAHGRNRITAERHYESTPQPAFIGAKDKQGCGATVATTELK